MTRKQARKHDVLCMKILIAVAVVLLLHMTASTIRGNQRQQEAAVEAKQTEQTEQEENEHIEQHTSTMQQMQKEQQQDKYSVFDTMSSDWGGEEDGFVYYGIPEEYTKNGGYFPEKMQIYTYCLCKQYGVRYSLIVAMIEHESGYVFDRLGDDGNSKGYMQIYESAHPDRMEELGCTELMNPYQNVRIGIDYISELIQKYGTMQDALAAYNYGEAGAKEHLWSNGIYVYEYNETIMRRMKEIEEVVGK